MPTRRVAMNVIGEVLRIRYECGRSSREIASARAVAGTVNHLLQSAASNACIGPCPQAA